MRYLWQHIQHILEKFRNDAPLHYFLKDYYRNNPKLGSRDRRSLSDAAYAWYRCGKVFAQDSHNQEEQLLAALFLCGLQPKAFLQHFPEAWKGNLAPDAKDRLALLKQEGYLLDLEQLFPAAVALSLQLERQQWLYSLLDQPRLFLRIRKNGEKVGRVLKAKEVPFEWLSDNCLALPNSTPIDQLILPEAYVVQDASSQATGRFFTPSPNEYWWDCCAGAGGKSLLLKDLLPSVRLLSSDIRESILKNLRDRFLLYDFPAPSTAVIDASDKNLLAKRMATRLFDGIICDVPCTGSGTWARTPESAYFFDPGVISYYTERGESILRNATDYVKPGGKLIYITCSVFKAENEAVVEKIALEKGLQIAEMNLINGIAQKADCLFVAVLKGF